MTTPPHATSPQLDVVVFRAHGEYTFSCTLGDVSPLPTDDGRLYRIDTLTADWSRRAGSPWRLRAAQVTGRICDLHGTPDTTTAPHTIHYTTATLPDELTQLLLQHEPGAAYTLRRRVHEHEQFLRDLLAHAARTGLDRSSALVAKIQDGLQRFTMPDSLVVLQPHSNTNPSDTFRVVSYQAWLRHANDPTTGDPPVIDEFASYAEAQGYADAHQSPPPDWSWQDERPTAAAPRPIAYDAPAVLRQPEPGEQQP